jgi:hypothetical protein
MMSYTHKTTTIGDLIKSEDWNSMSEALRAVYEGSADLNRLRVTQNTTVGGALSVTGDVGIGTNRPTEKLEVNGNLKLNAGAAVGEFSTDGTLADNSDTAVHTEKAVKAYADTKASLAGDAAQDFNVKNLSASGDRVRLTNDGVKLCLGDAEHVYIAEEGANDSDKLLLYGRHSIIAEVSGRRVEFKHYNDNNGIAFIPGRHNYGALGTSSKAWDDAYITEFWGDRQGSVSDVRIKEEVVGIDSALHNVMQMRGVYYNWKDINKYKDQIKKRETGVVAQEIGNFYPELLMTDNDGYHLYCLKPLKN